MEQISPHDQGVLYKRYLKRRMHRLMRRMARRFLDDAPIKFRFRGYSL